MASRTGRFAAAALLPILQWAREYDRAWLRGDVLAGLTDGLTDRQLEVLQTAYFSGYFEEPRARSASDVAASLGIAQPTFSSHLHAAERKLCAKLFERQPLQH